MDSLITEFTQQVIEYRHTSLLPQQLKRVAHHLRDVVEPRLADADRLEAENATLKKELAKLKKDSR